MSIFIRTLYRLRHLGTGFLLLLMTSTARGETTPLKHGMSNTLPGTDVDLASSEQDDMLSAEINSILHIPFEIVADSLTQASNWCEVMPLHFNIKACTHEIRDGGELLTVYSGRKIYEAPEDSYQMTYHFEVIQQDDSQLLLRLHADNGPINTRDYKIELQAQRVNAGTRLRIHSSYQPSWLSTMLTSSYLSTVGRNKEGFSLIDDNGELQPVKGIKGIIERNVMRYHLAINAFLSTQSLPKASRHMATLLNWFQQNNSFPQLHEMDEAEYLQIKQEEWNNQQQLQQALNDASQLAAAPYPEDN